ncbi:integrase catalytic domain-containing protein [Trichonephila clavipes]|nr:integrase catalytic domain-containing protein [Trichonephila clavipes]
MDILKLNKAKTSLKGSITRIATFMDNVSEHVDITELQVKLKKIDQLQRKIEELKELLFGLETAKPTEEAEFEEDLYKCETRLDDLEVRVKKLINSINVSLSVTAVEKNKYENGTFAQTKIPPIILPTFSGKYEQFSNFKSQFDDLITTNEQLTQSQKLYYLNSCLSNEVKEFASTFDTFSSLYEALESRYDNKRLIVDIHVQQILNFKKIEHNDSVDDTLKLFFELESLGIKDDPCYRKDDQAMNIFKETVQYNNNRYVVELPFRKHWNELSNNISVAKQRFQSLWGRLRRDKTLYTQYKETIQDYLNQGIIEKVNDTEINVHKPMYYLPHQAIKKEGRVTTSTRIVFDAASHQANELSLNDCLWPGPNLNPNLLDVLINFRLNRVAISSDIRQAFLQICLADKHKDFVRFLWTDSNPRIGEKLTLQVYRFNRVIFGVNSSPFLLAATIKYHIEKYNEIHPITVQHLDSFMYVDDWITGQDTREEALFMSRHAKNIMKEAGMEMRKWISNDTVLMAQWAAEGFDTHPMDASIRLGTNKTKVLGMAWQTLDDCLTLDTKDNLRIPRLVLDSTNDEVSDLIEIHIFCDASKLAYGAAAYVKVRKQNEVLVNLIASKTRVAPLKAVTLPRLELLGALVAARLSSRVQEIVRKKKECKMFHWTDSKIVLFWIKGSSKRWKQFVANRVQEISELTDPDSWFHCSGQDNPSDFLSRGLSVDTLISNNKWWTGPAFLRTDELPKTVSECPELNEVDYLPELKSKDSKEHTVLTLNFNQTFFDHLLSRSNKFLTIVRVLSFLYRFLFNIRNPTNKKTGPLTSDEMKEAEIYLMKQVQLSSFYKEIRAMQNGDDICNKSKILNLSPFLDDKGIVRVGGRLKHSRLPYSSKHPILLPAKSHSLRDSLQQRKKWIVNKENLKLGDMVLIREENLPPCKWLLGRVVKIYMGKDKKVRVVDIKTGKATRGLLATDHVIFNHGQVTWMTPELAPPVLTTTPQGEDVSALDRFNVHRCPTRRVFSGTGIELETKQATIRYLYYSATAAIKRLGTRLSE